MSTLRRKMKCPARLEVNNSGAWKVMLHFDVDDDVAVSEVRRIAEEMGCLCARLGGRMSWRITRPTPVFPSGPIVPETLQLWSPEAGWRDAQ